MAAAAAGAEGRRAALEAAAAAAPERGGGSCVLCCGDLEATALGRCDHPVCCRCSTKMRVLCEQRYCAVCREELRQVVFGKKLPAFASIPIHQLQHEKKYDIYFADAKVLALYRQLLQHECPRCPELPPFGLFADLEQHMRKQHELFCCKLCLQHLKIFTHERKWYSRKDLARHRMQGDPDDTSHRGHPLCKFCDERYLDNDELLKHLRRDHYFCHFCDSDGAQDYYSDYAYLREHFREKHFLCEEGRCSTEQFTHAFRTEIDLKAHRMACHSRSRAEARQNRQIDLQFSYAPRHSRREGVVSGEDYEEVDRYNRQGRAGRASGRGAQQSRRGSWRYKREEEDREVAAAIRASVAAQLQEEKHQGEDREEGGRTQKEEAAVRGPEEPRGPRRPVRTQGDGAGPKETLANGPVSQEALAAAGPAAGAAPLSALPPPAAKLKEEDFPSLCTSACSAPAAPGPPGLALAYAVPARGRSAFQEDDFPALVPSACKPSTAPTSIISAWNGGGGSRKVAQAGAGSPAGGGGGLPPRKAGKGGGKGRKGGPAPAEEDDGRAGLTAQELRSVPTTVTVSSLLALASCQASAKVGRRKKVGSEKPSAASPPPLPPDHTPKAPGDARTPGAEQVPGSRVNGPGAVVNGHVEGSAPAPCAPKEPPGLPRPLAPLACPPSQEEFPALGGPRAPRTPPPPGVSATPALLLGRRGCGWEGAAEGRLRPGTEARWAERARVRGSACQQGGPGAPARGAVRAGGADRLGLPGEGVPGRAGHVPPHRLQHCGAPKDRAASAPARPGAPRQQAAPRLLQPPAQPPPGLRPQHPHQNSQAGARTPGLPGPRELPGEEPGADPVHQGLPAERRGPLQQVQEPLGAVPTGHDLRRPVLPELPGPARGELPEDLQRAAGAPAGHGQAAGAAVGTRGPPQPREAPRHQAQEGQEGRVAAGHPGGPGLLRVPRLPAGAGARRRRQPPGAARRPRRGLPVPAGHCQSHHVAPAVRGPELPRPRASCVLPPVGLPGSQAAPCGAPWPNGPPASRQGACPTPPAITTRECPQGFQGLAQPLPHGLVWGALSSFGRKPGVGRAGCPEAAPPAGGMAVAPERRAGVRRRGCCVNSWLCCDLRMFRIKSWREVVLLEIESFYETN